MTVLTSDPQVATALRPSEYTAALIEALRARLDLVAGGHALEIGSGSGVVLAALGAMGAATLTGVDIEADAIEAGAALLSTTGYGAIASFHQGDMWAPVAGRRFDLVVANLPHFPMAPGAVGGRRPSWSSGGPDGRRYLDPYLDGLASHLEAGGRAFVTHNAFVHPETSEAVLARQGLAARIALTRLVYIPPEKIERMTPEVRRSEEGRTLHRHGPHVFGDVHILEIGAAGTLG